MSRIILKVSGKALKDEFDIVSKEKLGIVLETVKILKKHNDLVAIVVGGGNFFRGREHPEMDEIKRDTIGMLGTVMNALYISDTLEKENIKSIVDTPFEFPNLIDDLSDKKLKEEFEDGTVIVFGGGIGKYGYSTDSGTILAADKLGADLIIKMTDIDGIYDKDPDLYKDSTLYKKITYQEVLDKKLLVMDEYAVSECMKKGIKIKVMNFMNYKNILSDDEGTIVGG